MTPFVQRTFRPVPLVAGLLTLLLTGCDGRPSVVPAAGQVLIDDRPVTAGFIRVIPADARAAWGNIGPDGRFRLTTFEKYDGCVRGTHKVTVSAFEQSNSGTRWVAPQRYCDPATSDVTATINGPTDSLVIRLTSQGAVATEPADSPIDNTGDIDPANID
jgi:hypothetical protein